MSTEQRSVKSLDEIANMMAENTLAMRANQPRPHFNNDDKTPLTEVGNDDAKPDTDQAAAQVDDSDGHSAAAPADVPDDAVSDESNAEPNVDEISADEVGEEEVDDGSLGDDNAFEIDDDTLFEIDEGVELSYKDIKERLNADTATAELLETQKEATQEALTERARAQQDSTKAREAINAVFQHFDKVIATPIYAAPDETLKSSNPQQYIAQLEAYNADQQRIAQQRQDLLGAFNQHAEAEQELVNARRAQEVKVLEQKVPALKDPTRKKEASQDILQAAERFGFTPEEVNSAIDHRVYEMAYYAQQYFKIMDKSKQAPATAEEKKKVVKSQTRTLRSRGTTAKNRQTAKATKIRAIKAKAAKSGRVQDVADFIAAKAST